MDALDNFKKHWQDSPTAEEHYSKEQLTGFIASRSSSLTKWIFILGIAEFLFFGILGVLMLDETSMDQLKISGIYNIWIGYSILHYAVVIAFITMFYVNYKRIENTQPTRQLMRNILKVRRTMNIYVWYNILATAISFIVTALYVAFTDPKTQEILTKADQQGNLWKLYLVSGAIVLGIALVISLVLWLFYRLLYGILLKKLKRNYKELSRIEV